MRNSPGNIRLVDGIAPGFSLGRPAKKNRRSGVIQVVGDLRSPPRSGFKAHIEAMYENEEVMLRSCLNTPADGFVKISPILRNDTLQHDMLIGPRTKLQ